MLNQSQSWDFTSISTAGIILGQVLSFILARVVLKASAYVLMLSVDNGE